MLAGANSYTGATSIGDGTTLTLTGSLTGGGAISTAGSGVLNQSSPTSVISGASSVTLAGTGTSVLAGANSYTGATSIGTNTALSLTGSVNGTVITTAGTGVLNESSTGVISGAVPVNLVGTGTSTLGGSNSYSGVTVIANGIVNVASFSDYAFDGGLGNRPFSADVATNIGILFRGGTLQYTGSTPQSTNRAIRISTVGGATIDASGSIPSATLSFTAASSPDFFENPGGRNLTLTGSNTGDNTFGIAIINQGASATFLQKNGVGTWILTGSNTYTGQTHINAGALRVASTTGLGAGGFSGVTNTIVANGAALELQGGITVDEHFHFVGAGPAGLGGLRSVGGDNTLTTNFAIDGDSTIGVDAGKLTVTSQIYTDLFSGPGITKVGAGTLVFNNANSYTGPTNVNNGTLNINAALGNGSNILNANAGMTNIGVSQTFGELNIADGAVVTLGTPVMAPAPALMESGAAAVPEPGTLALLVLGALGLAGRRRNTSMR